jgi:transcriptional regulator with XRE-family HTH domain
MRRKYDVDRSFVLVQRLEPPFREPGEENRKLFGQRVRQARKKLAWTLEQASERADLSAKFLGEIERGMRRPSFESILALARALNVSPIVFFQFEEERMDATAVRERIDGVLAGHTAEQLQRAYRVLRAIVEP